MPSLLASRPSALLVAMPGWIAIAGMFGYGFGWPARPLWFWRAFAVPFSLFTMAGAGNVLGRLLAAIFAQPGSLHLSSVAAVLTAVPLIFLACVALLRFAKLLHARPRAPVPYEQIFA